LFRVDIGFQIGQNLGVVNRASKSNKPNSLEAAADLFQKGRIAECEGMCRKVLAEDAGNARVWFVLGLALEARGKTEEAIDAYRGVLEREPDFFPALSNLGTALSKSGRLAEAIEVFRAGTRFHPDVHQLYQNLSLALRQNWELPEAEAAARRAIELASEVASAHNALGAALAGQGRFAESVEPYEKAIALDPEFADAHLNLGLARLTLGDWRRAWPEYEWRFKSTGVPALAAHLLALPAWRGEDLGGKKILLHGEQGFGDFLMFARYVPLVAGRAGETFLECPTALGELAKTVPGQFTLVAPGAQVLPVQYRCSLLSLPGVFRTTPRTVRWSGAYISAPEEAVARWGEKVAAPSSKLNVGLVWAGSAGHLNDRWRSIRLGLLEPLGGVANVEFHSLQIGERAGEVASCGFPIRDWSKELTSFTETAGLISRLDLVIAVDTAVAHLAGAMGKAVWILLPAVGDWRWLVSGDKTAWYLTARLFRQEKRGEWGGVVERVRGELEGLGDKL
jgi:Flp pilus assembly protein TadD